MRYFPLETAALDQAMGAVFEGDFRADLDPRIQLALHGSKISSDGGLLLFRKLDEVPGVHELAARLGDL